MAELKFSESFNQFPGEFYHKTLESFHGNAVFSPISIQTALSLAMFGASGETLKEMKTGLKYSDFLEEKILKNFQKITENFGTGGISVANKIYLMKNYEVKKRFKEIAIKNFQSEAESVDFGKNEKTAKKINQWVESKTNNKIKNLMNADSLSSDTRLVLVNAIYFKAEWDLPFNPAANFKNYFYTYNEKSVEVEYMTQRNYFDYEEFDELDATAVRLFCKTSNVSMLFVLPKSQTGLPDLERKLHEIDFKDLLNEMFSEDIQLTVPKFKIEFDINLEDSLKKMGMARMFSDNAEFDNLLESSEPIKISKIIHKAFIEVNEEGTEATAVTVLGYEDLCEPMNFTLNHPFMFALIEDSKVLFLGRKVE